MAAVDDGSASSSGGFVWARSSSVRLSGGRGSCVGGSAWSRRGCSRWTRPARWSGKRLFCRWPASWASRGCCASSSCGGSIRAARFGEPQDVSPHGEGCGDLQGDPAAGQVVGAGAAGRLQGAGGERPGADRVAAGRVAVDDPGEGGGLRASGVSMAAVDEAWKVRSHTIEEGVTPTMVERAQPQLLLVSTAHRLTHGSDAGAPPGGAWPGSRRATGICSSSGRRRITPRSMMWLRGGRRRRTGRRDGNG